MTWAPPANSWIQGLVLRFPSPAQLQTERGLPSLAGKVRLRCLSGSLRTQASTWPVLRKDSFWPRQSSGENLASGIGFCWDLDAPAWAAFSKFFSVMGWKSHLREVTGAVKLTLHRISLWVPWRGSEEQKLKSSSPSVVAFICMLSFPQAHGGLQDDRAHVLPPCHRWGEPAPNNRHLLRPQYPWGL